MTPREFSERLAKRARKANVSLDPQAVESLAAYFRLLEFWNEKVNLTAFPLKGAPDEAIDRLLIEPLVVARHLRGAHGHGQGPHLSPHPRLLDIGSGGGSPAIPLKIAIPSLSLVMVESKTRKSAFLREAVRHLNLTDTSVETVRAEDLLTRPGTARITRPRQRQGRARRAETSDQHPGLPQAGRSGPAFQNLHRHRHPVARCPAAGLRSHLDPRREPPQPARCAEENALTRGMGQVRVAGSRPCST